MNKLKIARVGFRVDNDLPDVKLEPRAGNVLFASVNVDILDRPFELPFGSRGYRVNLTFVGARAWEMPDKVDAEEPLGVGIYDRSEDPIFGIYDLPRAERDAKFKKYYEIWQSTGECRTPGIYTVETSQWLSKKFPDATGLQHFLLVGRMMLLHVAATKFYWELDYPY